MPLTWRDVSTDATSLARFALCYPLKRTTGPDRVKRLGRSAWLPRPREGVAGYVTPIEIESRPRGWPTMAPPAVGFERPTDNRPCFLSPKTQPDGIQDAYAWQKGRRGAAAMDKLLDHLLLRMTDEELMVLGCNGDEKAFKEIYKRHKVRLILYISRYLGRHNAIAEDLFHDVWENLLKHREDYVPRAKFTTYLYTIAHNVVFDYFRRNKVEVDYFRRENGVWALPERGDEAEPEPREEPDIGISMDLEKALGQLSVEQCEAFIRHKRDGMTIPEIAKAAHEPADTVKSRYHYALAKLQGLLRSYKA